MGGVKYINDLLDENANFYTWERFSQIYKKNNQAFKPGKFFYLNTVDKSGTTPNKAMEKWSNILEMSITNDEWKHLYTLPKSNCGHQTTIPSTKIASQDYSY
jgi:hypothetical protein